MRRFAAALDDCEGGIDEKIVRLVVRDVPRHILRDLDHKALRDYKRKALHFHLDTRRPEIVRPEKGQAAPGRRASLADTVRDKLRSRAFSPRTSIAKHSSSSDCTTSAKRTWLRGRPSRKRSRETQ